MSSPSKHVVLSILLILFFGMAVSAHEGPPFPLFEDQKIDPYLVSVWTDPDVGTALFYVIVSTQQRTAPPSDLQVQIGVQPVSGRLAEVFYTGERENLKGQTQYRAQVHFDAQEIWRVRIRLQSVQGSGETVATVEATPPGYGRWDLLLYLLPFLAVGVLWAIAMIRKIKSRKEAQKSQKHA